MVLKTTTGPLAYLQLMFVYLKLTEQIDWRWPTVLIPMGALYLLRFLTHVLKETVTLINQQQAGETDAEEEKEIAWKTDQRDRLPKDDLDPEE